MRKALILNYHLIDNKEYIFNSFGGIYAVEIKIFEQQMNSLKECKVKVVSLDDILKNRVEEDFCVAITVDDGNPSDYDLIFPVLKQYGFTATFFLSIQNMEKNGVVWEKYRKMISAGFDIASHGLSHRDLTTLDKESVRDELLLSKLIIEENIKASVKFFSLPFGMYNRGVIRIAQEIGYSALFTTHFKLVQPAKRPFVMGRWSIKRDTPSIDFENIVQNKKIISTKYHYSSVLKKALILGLGTTLINKIYTFKNKYS